MKINRGKDVYEVTKNGKPLVGKGADMEVFLAFMPSCFRHVAVATFPLSLGPEAKDCLRAITCSVDMAYVDTVIEAAEKKWPGSATKAVKSVPKKTRMAKRRYTLGCGGPGAAPK